MSETKRRKSIQTITDPLLEPFFITKDEYSYTVKQNVTSDATHFRSKGNAKTYEKSLYYFASFDQALNKIAELQAGVDNYNSLNDFIKNYTKISTNIKKYTDGIRSIV
jgi:predicted HD phosphohydrolase